MGEGTRGEKVSDANLLILFFVLCAFSFHFFLSLLVLEKCYHCIEALRKLLCSQAPGLLPYHI